MKKYGLNFISDNDIYEHVKQTVLNYRFKINLSEFQSNILDPIKLTFDSKIYNRGIEAVLQDETIRQLDKSNTNHIGIFHHNIFKYFNNGWIVPEEGYDVVNEEQSIYVEIKNKHNTMNSSSSQKTYIKMQHTISQKPSAKCFLVEVIATNSQNIPWKICLDKISVSQENIRRVSIDKFYEIVTGDRFAFKRLCFILPTIIQDVISNEKVREKSNTVIEELKAIHPNLLKSIYISSFKNYEGFNDFDI